MIFEIGLVLAMAANLAATFFVWRKYMDIKQEAAQALARMDEAFETLSAAFSTLPAEFQKLFDHFEANPGTGTPGEPVMVGSLTDEEVSELIRKMEDKNRMAYSMAALVPTWVPNLLNSGDVNNNLLKPLPGSEA